MISFIGWTGSKCDTDINECLDSPCKNNATCNNNNGSYSCACVPGYTDANCETDIDECATTPCKNSGKCINGINKYTCNCSGTGKRAFIYWLINEISSRCTNLSNFQNQVSTAKISTPLSDLLVKNTNGLTYQLINSRSKYTQTYFWILKHKSFYAQIFLVKQ